MKYQFYNVLNIKPIKNYPLHSKYNTCFELIAFSIIDVPILVAAPTELVAIPAIKRGAAAPAVVNVKMPPAIVKLPPITLALVPTERPILHLYNCAR